MQPNFTQKKHNSIFKLTSLLLILMFLSASQSFAQSIIYKTTSTSTTGAEITSTGNGASTSMGDAIVMAGTNRYVSMVVVRVFTIASTAPFNLTMSMYTDCSTNGTSVACGTGPGVLIPGSTLTVSGITPTAVGTSFLVTFNFPTAINLSTEADNQINLVLNASRNDVFWYINETPITGSLPPGEPATSFVTRCGSTAGNNGCSRNFGVNNNFDIEITANATATTPCTGTPTPGQTNSTSTSACAGDMFTLSLANFTSGSGVTYKWQSSPTLTGTYSDIPLATNPTLTTSLTATTYYRSIVTCGANSGTSTPVVVNLTPASGCYCTAGATSASFEKIDNVKFGTINNTSTSTGGYENFTTISTNVIKGETLPITVTSAGSYDGDKLFVWIDFNQNGNFSDAGELVYTSPESAGPYMGNITIAPGALTGPTRMRIRLADQIFGTQNNTPCGNTTYGQVEDYTLNIQPCIPATFTNPAATTSVACGSNRTISIVTTGSIQAITWQTRPTATGTWQTITNGGIYSGATTATLTLTNVPQSLSGAQYRATVTGVCSAIDFSTPTTLTVTPLIATVTPTSQTICVGTIVPLTLTNAASTTTTTFNGSAGLPLAIPDDNITGVSNTINVSGIPAGSVIANASISIDLDHTWVGDVVLNLTAPNGQTINLIGALNNGTGGNGSDNFTNTVISSTGTTALSGAPAPRTGTFAADLFTATVPTIAPTTANAWAALLSGNINGAWKVSICDLAGPDDGILKSWSVILTYGVAATGSWTSTPTTPNTMFSDPAATIPYVANSQATTIYVKPTANTTYSVVYTNTTPCTSNPTNIAITVITPVTGVVSPVNTSVCVGGTATFTSSASGGPFSARQWQISTNSGVTWTSITGQTGSSLVLSNVMQTMNNYRYRVFYRTTPCVAAASDTSAAAILTVNPLPTVAISSSVLQLIPGRTTTITATSTPAAAANGWSWTRDGVLIAGNTNTQVVGIAGVGTYQATVTDINGCVGKSNNLVIGSEASDRLWIYPNPTNGMFQVRLYYMSDVAQRRVVSIFNSQGQLVQEKSFSLLSNSQPYMAMDFDFTNKPAGTYLIKATEDITGKTVSGFIIIQ